MPSKFLFYLFIIACAILVMLSCATYSRYFRSNYRDANSLLHETHNLSTVPFLKAHLKNGDICILRENWQIDNKTNSVTGNGVKYNFNRLKVFNGNISIPIDSIVIFETNAKIKYSESSKVAALSILAGFDLLLGIACVTIPKACFGSCPTFYLNEDDDFHYADAEGFSNAISPSLEYFDIDALNNTSSTQSSLSLTMKNEALETHCINEVKLLGYPRNSGERVYQTPSNEFYLCKGLCPLTNAVGKEGDITSLLINEDRQERFSQSDSNNLSSKEEIILNFNPVPNSDQLGLLLHFRQTLMTTYFIYSAMGYMGDEVSDIFASIETNKETKESLEGGIKKELGDIDVYAWNDQMKDWKFQNRFYETGPIAINRQIIPLDCSSINSKIKIKLVLNKGLWRIDYIGLTSIMQKVHPIDIMPIEVLNNGVPDKSALTALRDSKNYLISMPGNKYTIKFRFPSSKTDYELFLYSKGYYLEWMRENWLKDKDLLKLKQMLKNPNAYLKSETKNFKRYESDMEHEFWNSKIYTKTFTTHEN